MSGRLCPSLRWSRYRLQGESRLLFQQPSLILLLVRRPGALGEIHVWLTAIGNVIASYYLGTMLNNAGVTNTTTQLKIVGGFHQLRRMDTDFILEYHPQCLVLGPLNRPHLFCRHLGTKANSNRQHCIAHYLFVHYWRFDERFVRARIASNTRS